MLRFMKRILIYKKFFGNGSEFRRGVGSSFANITRRNYREIERRNYLERRTRIVGGSFVGTSNAQTSRNVKYLRGLVYIDDSTRDAGKGG